jgi:hypothetical protein
LRENIAESKLSYEIMDDATFPQDQNHGQHSKVLLFDLLHRIPS